MPAKASAKRKSTDTATPAPSSATKKGKQNGGAAAVTSSSSNGQGESKFGFSADKNGHKAPADIYDGKLSYGPAPESPDAVYAWMKAHNNKFGHFIDNEWYHPKGRKFRDSKCPATKETMCQTMEGLPEDVDKAVASAKAAQVKWAAVSPHERAKVMYSIARHVQKHARLLSVLEALDNGKSFRETRDADIPVVARHIYHYAGWAQLADTEMRGWAPVGVVGGIVPWNFPLMLLVWKLAPALAMGNTIVVKPASYTRLSALLFAEICAEAGLPPGCFNVITGSGAIGSVIADHKDVDKIGFTGSTPVGRILRQRIAGSGKKISLELGGKSPIVVYDTADLDSTVEGVVDAIWFNQGQVCSAGSRLLVQESVADKLISKLKRRMDTFRIGHPLEKDIDMAALVDKSQYTTISGYCERAKAEGADVYLANVEVPTAGWFWPPTLVTNVSTSSEVVRDEIFGPVLAVMTFRNPAEAIKLANNTYFGLGASVWTENISLAMETAISIQAGSVWINGHNMFDAAAGFGGYRESGFGRDGGKEGLYEYVKPAWQAKVRPTDITLPCMAPQWPKARTAIVADVKSSNSAVRTNADGALIIDRTPKVYIGGKQKRPDGNYSMPVLTPSGALINEVAEGNRKDIRDAVEAAFKAAPGWGKRAAHNRAQICYFIAENLMARSDEFAKRIGVQTGRDEKSCKAEVAASINRLFHYAAYADKYGGTVQETTLYGLTAKIMEPVGTVAIACPDEFPLLGFISLIAPALIRGNTVVVLPSEKHPLSATDLYQVFETSDLPGGVCNIVTGERDVLTRTLAEHRNIQAIWYFGTSNGSQCVEFAAGDNMKRSWVNYGAKRDWMDLEQGQGEEFLIQATEVKNVWVPMGDIQ